MCIASRTIQVLRIIGRGLVVETNYTTMYQLLSPCHALTHTSVHRSAWTREKNVPL